MNIFYDITSNMLCPNVYLALSTDCSLLLPVFQQLQFFLTNTHQNFSTTSQKYATQNL